MRIVASIAASLDGFIDDNSPERLILSDEADWKEVYALRRECDAVLVGAETIRRDNPSFKDIAIKVIVSGSGNIPSAAKVLCSGQVIIFTTCHYNIDAFSGGNVEVIEQEHITAMSICRELGRRGISRLLVEGGAKTMAMFLDEECIDELRIAVAPVVVKSGVKMVAAPQVAVSRNIRKVGRMTVSEYILKPDCNIVYLQEAINLSRLTPPSDTAYSVGAVIITAGGEKFTGYTHQTAPNNHAEEEAIARALEARASLNGATIYSSLEPCSVRRSKAVSCSELIINHRFAMVVYAAAEPECFVCCDGAKKMRDAGIAVHQIKQLAPQVMAINSHIVNKSLQSYI